MSASPGRRGHDKQSARRSPGRSVTYRPSCVDLRHPIPTRGYWNPRMVEENGLPSKQGGCGRGAGACSLEELSPLKKPTAVLPQVHERVSSGNKLPRHLSPVITSVALMPTRTASSAQVATLTVSTTALDTCDRCSRWFLTGHRLCDHIVQRLRVPHKKPEPRLL